MIIDGEYSWLRLTPLRFESDPINFVIGHVRKLDIFCYGHNEWSWYNVDIARFRLGHGFG